MERTSQTLRYVNLMFLAAFLGSAIVQWNDPDPLRWIVIYLLASVACVLFAVGRLAWWIAAATSMIALVWAGSIAPSVIGKTSLAEIFQSYKMKSLKVELAREMGGLVLMGIWMGFLALISKRSQSTPEEEKNLSH